LTVGSVPTSRGARDGSRSALWPTLVLVGLALALTATVATAGSAGREVVLRSGVIEPSRQLDDAAADDTSGPRRMVVRFRHPPGWFEKGALESAGTRIETPLPGQAYLVTVPAGRPASLARIPGVDWAAPYLPQDKIAPEIAAVASTAKDESDVIVLLHLFRDASPAAVATELADAGLRIEGARGGTRFGRIVLRMTPDEVASRRSVLAERNDIFWIERRHRRILVNDDSIWVGQSGLEGGMTTPVFNHGIFGSGQIAAILDTGLDADMCYFRDDVNGLPPTNTGGGTTVDTNQRKVLAVDFLDTSENPADPTHWDTHGHGTFVAGILAGDDFATPIEHDPKDGMAPGAKLVIQDAGYAADDCGDLPGIGCPVTDLNPIFQQAYDQGARVHNNSWNDNENADVQNLYTDASEDVDEFMWNNPDFLIVFACGNQGWPDADNLGTVGSPSTAKNGMSVGATYGGEYSFFLADLSSWGPTSDGRIKPEVVFPGQSVYSASGDEDIGTDNCTSSGGTGTSYASPGVAGNALLVREYFMEGWYPTGWPTPSDAFTPSAALLKAMLVNSAVSIERNQSNEIITIPHAAQGWGRILLDNALYFAGDARDLWVDEYTGGFTSPSDPPVTYMLEMDDTGEPLEVTLAWTDFPSTPAASIHLINDLDLRVDGPSGGFVGNNFLHGVSLHGGAHDRLNNLEQVLIEDPAPGVYSITISPHAVPSGPQPFSLVVTGGRFTVTTGPRPSYYAHLVDDSGPNGNGDGVLDPGETATIPVTLWNSGDADATSVLGHLYSSHPTLLKVYDGTASYGDMTVGGQAGSASPHYEVTLEPSANCGQVLGATMSITGAGFEVGSAFTLDIGQYEGDRPSPDTPMQAPRNGEANSYINVSSTFPLTEVDVTVNIDHTNIGDLEVLVYPPGTTNPPVYLHNNSGAGTSGIHTTYDTLTEPDGPGSLDSFVGLDPQGNWRLKVVNSGNKNGTLENWTLHLKSYDPFDCNPVGCGDGVPSPVGNTLVVGKSGSSDIQLTWGGVGESQYHGWRAADATFRTAVFVGASGGATSLVDAGAQTLPGIHYYQVRSANSCRWESP
jgi:subtilisin-like proprotein convertase family protein